VIITLSFVQWTPTYKHSHLQHSPYLRLGSYLKELLWLIMLIPCHFIQQKRLISIVDSSILGLLTVQYSVAFCLKVHKLKFTSVYILCFEFSSFWCCGALLIRKLLRFLYVIRHWMRLVVVGGTKWWLSKIGNYNSSVGPDFHTWLFSSFLCDLFSLKEKATNKLVREQ